MWKSTFGFFAVSYVYFMTVRFFGWSLWKEWKGVDCKNFTIERERWKENFFLSILRGEEVMNVRFIDFFLLLIKNRRDKGKLTRNVEVRWRVETVGQMMAAWWAFCTSSVFVFVRLLKTTRRESIDKLKWLMRLFRSFFSDRKIRWTSNLKFEKVFQWIVKLLTNLYNHLKMIFSLSSKEKRKIYSISQLSSIIKLNIIAQLLMIVLEESRPSLIYSSYHEFTCQNLQTVQRKRKKKIASERLSNL